MEKIHCILFLILLNSMNFMKSSSWAELINYYLKLMIENGDYSYYYSLKACLGDIVAIEVCSSKYPSYICEVIIRTYMANVATSPPPECQEVPQTPAKKFEILQSILSEKEKEKGFSNPKDFQKNALKIKRRFPEIFGK